MRIGNLEVPGMLALAPMAGVTDLAFRTVCADLGADMTVTEMVSSRALVYQDKKSRGLLKKNEGSVCGAQIFGNEPAIMAEAAVMAAEISGCDFIDINSTLLLVGHNIRIYLLGVKVSHLCNLTIRALYSCH